MQVKGPAARRGGQLRKPGVLALLLALPALASAPGCAPVRVYRPVPAPTVRPAPAPQASSLPSTPEPERRPALEDSRIKEEDLKERRPAPQARSKDRSGRPAPVDERMAPFREAPAPLPDDRSLLAKITPRTAPQRAASLRITEEGRKLIESGDYAKALARLEKTISIDSTNPYGYYYLAQTHFRLGRYQDSLNFLDVAESLLSNEPFWLAEVFALKGENFRALGSLERADSNYAEALRLNSGNRVAADGLNSLRVESQPSSR